MSTTPSLAACFEAVADAVVAGEYPRAEEWLRAAARRAGDDDARRASREAQVVGLRLFVQQAKERQLRAWGRKSPA